MNFARSSSSSKRLFFSIAACSTLAVGSTRSFHNSMAGSRASIPAVQAYNSSRFSKWPYTTQDGIMTPQDSTPDHNFYSSPRYVTHIDDDAIADLRTYYASNLPRKGTILDLCSSWISHFPPELEQSISTTNDLKVIGVGMHQNELDKNPILTAGRIVHDLNISPSLTHEDLNLEHTTKLDATVCVVSIDYLTQPLEVLKSIHTLSNCGGKIHLVISNRCFPTKAVGRWLRIDEAERLQMVGDYLHFSGWRNIEIVTLSDGKPRDQTGAGEVGESRQTTLSSILRIMGMEGRDPLWVVRGVKETE